MKKTVRKKKLEFRIDTVYDIALLKRIKRCDLFKQMLDKRRTKKHWNKVQKQIRNKRKDKQ